ncbi:hypothetical protein [Amycolatopsis sp. NPDC059021]|uniref:hypothetical protein n=1 Tax=Amycolatopsis sp. NPDC059021 TaxID=3346704 RepID=UPI00366E2ABD
MAPEARSPATRNASAASSSGTVGDHRPGDLGVGGQQCRGLFGVAVVGGDEEFEVGLTTLLTGFRALMRSSR